jgi:hypothetical protein
MFVRWERRQRQSSQWRRDGPAEILHVARLVESSRVDGQPRQRTIAYLGSIRDRHLQSPWCRQAFWTRDVAPRLAALDLPDGQRERIEKALAEVVARPTRAEVEQGAQAARKLEAKMSQHRR